VLSATPVRPAPGRQLRGEAVPGSEQEGPEPDGSGAGLVDRQPRHPGGAGDPAGPVAGPHAARITSAKWSANRRRPSLNGRLDVITANALGRALFSPVCHEPDDTPERRPVRVPGPAGPHVCREWDKVANDTVTILRAR